MSQLSHGRPVPAQSRPSASPWHARKDTIVLQLLDLLTAFSLADLFAAVPDVVSWEN
jgi:hypothetical protein